MEHWQVLPPLSQLQETDKRCVMLTVTEFDHVQGYKLILRRVSDSRQSWCNLLDWHRVSSSGSKGTSSRARLSWAVCVETACSLKKRKKQAGSASNVRQWRSCERACASSWLACLQGQWPCTRARCLQQEARSDPSHASASWRRRVETQCYRLSQI